MAGLVPAISIHLARRAFLSEITGTSPVMTVDLTFADPVMPDRP